MDRFWLHIICASLLLLVTAFALGTPGLKSEGPPRKRFCYGSRPDEAAMVPMLMPVGAARAKRRREKFSLRRAQAGRCKPLLHMGSRFSLSRSAEKPFALNAGRGASRLFSQALRLIGQALVQWRGLLYTTSLLHGVTPYTRRRERWAPLPWGRAVMMESRLSSDGKSVH